MAEASTHPTIIQLFSDWEFHALILLSFALQLLLFFTSGLRRRHNHKLLTIMIWLSYLSADFIAAFALGHLSVNLTTTSTPDANDHHNKPSRQLMLLWVPFLLIHLGGQDTVTAFSLEDNELWLRHLLNLVCQACLVVYVLWKWVALVHYQLIIPTALLFVAGIIKYGERIWALKLGSQTGLRTSTSREAKKASLQVSDSIKNVQSYEAIVKYAALHSERGVRAIFAGRKNIDMDVPTRVKFEYRSLYDEEAPGGNVQVSFKRAEIELSMMYDSFFTKSRVIQTRTGAILRCISLASTVVAFVLYIIVMMTSSAHADQTNKEHIRSRVDAAVTYILFIGAFFLEACSFVMVLMSPWEWPLLEARAGLCHMLLSRVVWPIFLRIQPETKPWWSNSMGQYNLFSSSRSTASATQDNKKCSSTIVMAKMASIIGVSEMWNKMSNTRHAQVTTEIKELIHGSSSGRSFKLMRVPRAYSLLFTRPFEHALLMLHLWTDVVVHKAAKSTTQDQEQKVARQQIMDTCKRLSEYMMYLLVTHPAGDVHEAVSTNVQDVLAAESDRVRVASSKDDIFAKYTEGDSSDDSDFWSHRSGVLQNEGGIHAELERLERVWVRMLVYAAGKCRPEEHARRLSTGGELITLVWLFLAHQGVGDLGVPISLMRDTGANDLPLFDFDDSLLGPFP